MINVDTIYMRIYSQCYDFILLISLSTVRGYTNNSSKETAKTKSPFYSSDFGCKRYCHDHDGWSGGQSERLGGQAYGQIHFV